MADDAVWHVLVKTRNGRVSLLKNLTKDEARKVMQRLQKPTSSDLRICLDDDVVQLEGFGPEGETLFDLAPASTAGEGVGEEIDAQDRFEITQGKPVKLP